MTNESIIRANELRWIGTLGGPHILIPESALTQWQGAPRDYPDSEGDYGRACDVDGYLGLIDVGSAQALVIGDEPALTTYLPEYRLLVRWVAAPSAEDIIRAAIGVISSATWEEELNWDISEPVILIDSVVAGDEVAFESDDLKLESLRIEVPPGRYRVRAAYVQTDVVYMILVRLVAMAGEGQS